MGLLVLTRRVGERIVLREKGEVPLICTIEVVEKRDKFDGPGKVRLAFDAPPHIEIWREELILEGER